MTITSPPPKKKRKIRGKEERKRVEKEKNDVGKLRNPPKAVIYRLL